MCFSSAYFLRMEDEVVEDEEANLKSQFFIYESQKPNVSIREKTPWEQLNRETANFEPK